MNYITYIREKVGHDPIFMPGAGAIIIKDNKILLQRRRDDNKWACHGGCMNFGETFDDVLQRKLQEDLNIEVENYELIDVYSGEEMHHVYPNKDEVYTVAAMYIVTSYKGELKINNKDVLEIKWFDLDNLPENIHKADVKPILDGINKFTKN